MYKDICQPDRQLPIQQLNKLNEKGTERQDFFPLSIVQAIFDKTGIRLDAIISSFNYIFLPYKGTKEDTRLQVIGLMRRKSLVICYRDLDDNTTIEMYIGNDRGDNAWKDSNNWKDFAEWLGEAVEEILSNIDDYPNIKESIINAVRDFVSEYLDQIVPTIINEWITNNAQTAIDNAVENYLDSEEFKTIVEGDISNIVNNYLGDNLEPLVGEFLTQIVTYLRDNERVIANALARHEQAITELQNT